MLHAIEEGTTAAGRKRMECSCGWDGPTRSSRSELDADLAAHARYAAALVLDESRGLGWGPEHEAKVAAEFRVV